MYAATPPTCASERVVIQSTSTAILLHCPNERHVARHNIDIAQRPLDGLKAYAREPLAACYATRSAQIMAQAIWAQEDPVFDAPDGSGRNCHIFAACITHSISAVHFYIGKRQTHLCGRFVCMFVSTKDIAF